MAFNWLGVFRQGSWRDYRRFVLDEKRDVLKRVATIQAKINRIGDVIVVYDTTEVDGVSTVTERRRGLWVTPGSFIEKLLQTYIVHGGNPFDISLFLQPNNTIQTSSGAVDSYPYGGVLSPRTVPLAEIGSSDGGYLPHNAYLPYRLGSRQVIWDKAFPITNQIKVTRGWVSNEIRFKRSDIEARIIKQMDYREQLILELDSLEQAVGGTLIGLGFRDEFFSQAHRIQNIIHGIDSVFYGAKPGGGLSYDIPGIEDRITGRYQTLLNDLDNGQEEWTAL